jgi:HD superfamily phosphohydrolase
MILRDPVHGLVSFESEEDAIVVELLKTRELQRLRHIRQLGLTSLVYPGADHTRFSHAVGAAFVMTRFVERLRKEHDSLPYWQRLTSERAREGIAAALLHDVGHGPFSHLFEEALPDGPLHETWTERIILDPSTEVHQVLRRADPKLPERVSELIHGRHPLTYLARTVSGTFDVDRCDYLLRDAHATGVSYGHFDLDWLVRSLRLGVSEDPDQAPPLAIDGTRGLPAIESFILARLFMFQQVYFHKASRASEWMLRGIMGRVRELLTDGTPVPGLPRGIEELALRGDTSLGEYLQLDDPRLWTALSAWQSAKDPLLSDLAQRLYRRRLFKTVDLFGEHASPSGQAAALLLAEEAAARVGLRPATYVGLDVAELTPFDGLDTSLSVLLPDGSAQAPVEVSFLLRRLAGQTLQQVRLIVAPEIRDEVRRALGA